MLYIRVGLLFLLITTAWNTFSQELTISGTVTDAELAEPLIGVNIFDPNNRIKGTTTDFDGNYTLTVDKGSTIIFRYVGFRDTSLVVNASGKINIEMIAASMDLNTVVVSASRRKEKILDAPAAISIIDSRKIESKAAINTQDFLKDVSGVHIIKSGIQGGTPTVRGMGGYLTSNLMTLIDNRSAQVPNFRNNDFSLISTSVDDIERIEVLKGPASALYGPNTSEGVVHMITKSPIGHQQTKFTVGMGVRSAIDGPIAIANEEDPKYDAQDITERLIGSLAVRHAGLIHFQNKRLKAGYKLSSGFFRGLDWKYDDPNDPEKVVKYIPTANGIIPLKANGQPLSEAEMAAGQTGALVDNERNEVITKWNIDTRFDFRIGEELEIVTAAGFNISDGIMMTPIGAAQQIGWKYSYFQTRVLWRNFFVQGYGNFSNSGDSYYLPTGGRLIDRSRYYAFQAQHFWQPLQQLKFTYGLDAFFTRANTNYTLNGRFEDMDDVNELGVYLQGDYEIHPRLKILMASRIDYHNQSKTPVVSPRAAILYKPGTGHNLRVTFNRAFRNAGTSAYFVDVRQASFPTGIGIRALGTQSDGFQYSYAVNPNFENQLLPQFRSPFNGDEYAYLNVGDKSINNAGWQGILDAIVSELPKQLGFNGDLPPVFNDLVNDMIGALLPSDMSDVDQVVKDFNATYREFVESDWQNLQDISALKPVVTYSYEAGYKGLIANFLMLSVDFYKTDHKNFLAPVTFVTPGVLLDPEQVSAKVNPYLSAALNDPANEVYKTLLVTLLDRNRGLGGNFNGDPLDELLPFLEQAFNNLPIGTITPQQATGSEMLLVTRNIGDVSVYGLEGVVTAYITKQARIDAYYSWVDKDSIVVPGAQFGYVALNAPKHRFSIGGGYNFEKIGLNVGARFNWQAGFPVNSGNFVGHVPAYHEMDVDLSWTPPTYDKVNITLSVSNIYNNVHQHFIGSPEIGMLSVLKASYTL
ncbi:MAG: TonB-dependent receptor [Chitinophagales bacterium]